MSSESEAGSSAMLRRDEDAAERGERRADGPAVESDPVGPGAVEQRQRAVVHVGPHGDADAGAEEEEAQADRDQDGDGDGDGLVVGDRRHAEVDRPGLEEPPHVPADARLPDQVGEADNAHEEADRHDELRRFRRAHQPPHDHPFEQQAERGARTHSTTNSATGAGQPQPKRSCQ